MCVCVRVYSCLGLKGMVEQAPDCCCGHLTLISRSFTGKAKCGGRGGGSEKCHGKAMR